VDESEGTGTKQYVLFRLCGEEYGLPIERVQGIIRYEQPTPVPHAPTGVEGVFNLRGQVLPMIDLGRRMRGEPINPTVSSRVIVAEAGMGPVGLVVDLVHEVARLPVAGIRPVPPGTIGGEMGEAFEGVASYKDRLVILLDPDKALPQPAFGAGQGAQEGDADV